MTLIRALSPFTLAAAALLLPEASALADSSFAIKVSAPPAAPQKRAVAKIHIAPGAGFHVNKDYPTVVSVVAPPGVMVEKARQTAKDAVRLEEAGADFDIAFTPKEPGKKVFTGELKFAVCSADSCDPKKEQLAFTVEVK
jgi:hypothetical protein